MARPYSRYSISIEDKDELSSGLRASNIRPSLAQRAQILLLSDEGMNVDMIAEKLGCTTGTIYKWRKRYKVDGVDALHDRPRPGQPTKITPETVEWVMKATTERVPKGATHGSVQLTAKDAGITSWQVQQIWKSADLKPHRLKTFKISNDPQFARKIVDVGLYMDPPDNLTNWDTSSPLIRYCPMLKSFINIVHQHVERAYEEEIHCPTETAAEC